MGEELKDTLTGLAAEFVETEASGLALQYAGMIGTLSPAQKELAGKIALVKSTDTGELNTLDEVEEYNNLLQEAAALNLEISKELSQFWDQVAALAKEASVKFANVAVKVASKALIAAILI